MINLETVKALRALRLPGMANELESQLEQLNIEYASIEAQVLGSRAELSNKQQDLVRLEAEQKACENELLNLNDSFESAQNEINDCLNKIEVLKKSREQARQRLTELSLKISDAEQKVNVLTGSRAELTEKRDIVQSTERSAVKRRRPKIKASLMKKRAPPRAINWPWSVCPDRQPMAHAVVSARTAA